MRRSIISKLPALLLIGALLLGALPGIGISYSQQQQNVEPAPLQPRPIFSKPAKTVINDSEAAKVVVLKFHEGTRVRLRDGQLTAEAEARTAQEQELLKRNQLTEDQIKQELAAIIGLLKTYTVELERAFARKEEELDDEKRAGELNTGEELADLNLYYHLFPAQPQVELTAQLVDQLNALSSVETAYALPPSQPAQADLPPFTASYIARQGYLNEANDINPASNGIDARYAWTRGGGLGDGVRVIDIEQGWTLDHEDLRPTFFSDGEFNDAFDWKQHGTAVLGVIGGAANSYGVTGIAPQAALGVVSELRRTASGVRWNPANAISTAAAQLRPGDVILLEMHLAGPASGETCTSNCGQFELVAVEYYQELFDVIRAATARGVIVVEAAGNGSMNLDHDRYDGRFRRPGAHPRGRDSGAIIVGAGGSTNRAPHPWSNFGSRVDVQAWGDSVMSLGYGGIMINGADQRQWYTLSFGGTSSASAIVAGAVASLQGIRRYANRPLLNSVEMRNLLNSSGVPQPGGTPLIGPLVNLRAAISRMGLGSRRPAEQRLLLVRESDRDVDTGLDIQPGDRVVFEADGEMWSGEYFLGAYGILFPVPNNGPGGWRTGIANGYGFPLRGVRPYSLLARLGSASYFTVGRSNEHRHIGAAQRLYLRINDDNPGNGNGDFLCWVQVYR